MCAPEMLFAQIATRLVTSLHPGLWPGVTFSKGLYLTFPPKKASFLPLSLVYFIAYIIFLCNTYHYETLHYTLICFFANCLSAAPERKHHSSGQVSSVLLSV